MDTYPLCVFGLWLDDLGWGVPINGQVNGFFEVGPVIVHSLVSHDEGAGEQMDISLHLLPAGLNPDGYLAWWFGDGDWLQVAVSDNNAFMIRHTGYIFHVPDKSGLVGDEHVQHGVSLFTALSHMLHDIVSTCL